MNEYEKISFKDNEIELIILFSRKERTVWLTTQQIALLFRKTRQAISWQIKQLQSLEKDKQNFAQLTRFICTSSKKPIAHYNLQAVLIVGEELNSDKGRLLNEYVEDYLIGLNELVIPENNEVVIYNNGKVYVDINISRKEETVWLNQERIALIFETTQQDVSYHIINILQEEELDKISVHKEILYTASDGKTYNVDFYNLDMILAIGFRITTEKARKFRMWAYSVLKEHIVKGYSVDEDRIRVLEENYVYASNKIENINLRIQKLEEIRNNEVEKEKVFVEGTFFDAYEYICSLFRKAKQSVTIVDPYFDKKGLVMMEEVDKDVKKKVYISHKSKLKQEELEVYEKQYGRTDVVVIDSIHDRFIFIDNNECYLMGTSLNYAGDKTFAIIKMENKTAIQAVLTDLEK